MRFHLSVRRRIVVTVPSELSLMNIKNISMRSQRNKNQQVAE